MKVFGKKIFAGLLDQIIEEAINAFSYSQRAQDFQNALKEYKDYGGKSTSQIKRYEELYDNWQAASETAKLFLESTSKEMLQEALNQLSTTEGVDNDESNQKAIQELKIALGQGN